MLVSEAGKATLVSASQLSKAPSPMLVSEAGKAKLVSASQCRPSQKRNAASTEACEACTSPDARERGARGESDARQPRAAHQKAASAMLVTEAGTVYEGSAEPITY
jgi:hypothetical protein